MRKNVSRSLRAIEGEAIVAKDAVPFTNLNVNKARNGYIVNVDGRQYVATDAATIGSLVADILSGKEAESA
jgi:hypothetical protein